MVCPLVGLSFSEFLGWPVSWSTHQSVLWLICWSWLIRWSLSGLAVPWKVSALVDLLVAELIHCTGHRLVSQSGIGWVVSLLVGQSFGQSVSFLVCQLVHLCGVIHWDGPTVNRSLALSLCWFLGRAIWSLRQSVCPSFNPHSAPGWLCHLFCRSVDLQVVCRSVSLTSLGLLVLLCIFDGPLAMVSLVP